MNFAKIVGWILLIAGVLLIGWALLSSYNIFVAKASVPEFFEMPEEETAPTKGEAVQDAQTQVQQMVGEQLKGIFPVESITKLFNLIVWSLLVFILIFGGTQIAGLGIKMIR